MHESKSDQIAKKYCKKLKNHIPSALFTITIQAQVGKKIVCREDIKALRKNVTAKW